LKALLKVYKVFHDFRA